MGVDGPRPFKGVDMLSPCQFFATCWGVCVCVCVCMAAAPHLTRLCLLFCASRNVQLDILASTSWFIFAGYSALQLIPFSQLRRHARSTHLNVSNPHYHRRRTFRMWTAAVWRESKSTLPALCAERPRSWTSAPCRYIATGCVLANKGTSRPG
jgi:hypothetical protein